MRKQKTALVFTFSNGQMTSRAKKTVKLRASEKVSRANSKKFDVILPSIPHNMFSSG